MLDRYRAILSGERLPYFLQAKGREEDTDYSDKNLDELLNIHAEALKTGLPSLKLKGEIADRILENCKFCERRCGINRKKGEKGYCQVGKTQVSSEFLHLGEERELVPSHTIFFAGCNFECIFCQNWEISQENEGRWIEPAVIANKIEQANSKNVNWVGGDPTPNIPYILEVLSKLSKPLPQIWNSNMYLSDEGMQILAKLMDVYLTDFKYGNDECARRLSDVENYTEVVKRNHLTAEETGDLVIRHLVLPGHLECCTEPVLRWIDENLDNPRVNIMSQYRPEYHSSGSPEIDCFLSDKEEREIERLRKKYQHLTTP